MLTYCQPWYWHCMTWEYYGIRVISAETSDAETLTALTYAQTVGMRRQADKSRVKDYIHRLDNFDGPAVGEIAVGYEMFEEAFEIYKKFGLKTQAIRVLLDHQEDLDRALEYALKVAVSVSKVCACRIVRRSVEQMQ